MFAQDNAFGQGNLAAVEGVLGGQGATVSEVLVPEDATEFTPFAQQILGADARPRVRGLGRGHHRRDVAGACQQGVFDAVPVVTGLATSPPTAPTVTRATRSPS